MILVNSHPVIDFAESLPPNVIEVGGLQIKETEKIDNEIEKFLAKGIEGSILMSLGSNIRSDRLGTDRIEMFIQAFAELPDYNFLWKFETPDKLKDKLPPNVMIRKWVKQNDVLGHANLKAFITHAGLLSTHEATYHGVPMIGIPFFTDQFRNAYRSEQAGVGLKVDIRKISVDEIKEKILKVVKNPKFKENSKIRSNLFKDRPIKPLDLAVWWCEYILRNSKPSHLKFNEFKLGLLESRFFDIQLIILIIFIIFIIGVKYFFKKICLHKKLDMCKKR